MGGKSSRESEGSHVHFLNKKQGLDWLHHNLCPSIIAYLPEGWIETLYEELNIYDDSKKCLILHLKQGFIAISSDPHSAENKDSIFQNLEPLEAIFQIQTPQLLPQLNKPVQLTFALYKKSTQPASKEALEKALTSKGLPKIQIEQLIKDCPLMTQSFIHHLSSEELMVTAHLLQEASCQMGCHYQLDHTPSSYTLTLAWSVHPIDGVDLIRAFCKRHHLLVQEILFYELNTHPLHPKVYARCVFKAPNLLDCQSLDLFIQELTLLPFYRHTDELYPLFLENQLSYFYPLVKSISTLIHQFIALHEPDAYLPRNILHLFLSCPDILKELLAAFTFKFHPTKNDPSALQLSLKQAHVAIGQLDCEFSRFEYQKKVVFELFYQFILHCLKTNFYVSQRASLSFRLHPNLLRQLPYDTQELFPVLPYGLFFIQGANHFGFHIRFKDLARGGLRTIFPQNIEKLQLDRPSVFNECYQLAWTQQKKNKDIPEGGAKGVILIDQILYTDPIDQNLYGTFLYQAQKDFVSALLDCVNTQKEQTLALSAILDYLGSAEYLYLGPDENMQDVMIEWIAHLSAQRGYRPSKAFISGKPSLGINHKEFGVTSLGVHVYLKKGLEALSIDPAHQSFSLKMTGGPDGDVAGNEILNLYNDFSKTAKLLAITDVSGTLYDPSGLQLAELVKLFKEQKSISFYNPAHLQAGGFLLKITPSAQAPSHETPICQQCATSQGVIETRWLTEREGQHLYRHFLHQCPVDVFLPCGGRPRTLSEKNIEDFLQTSGEPTAKLIVEGANLYLSHGARQTLEDLGTLIFKDSSANKCGVICSSFEIICGLCLTDSEFLEHKQVLVEQILQLLIQKAEKEASLILKTHAKTQQPLTEISDLVSKKINKLTDEIASYLQDKVLPTDPQSQEMRCLLDYVPDLLRDKFKESLIEHLPDNHKKAILATHLSCHLIYKEGLKFELAIADLWEKWMDTQKWQQ